MYVKRENEKNKIKILDRCLHETKPYEEDKLIFKSKEFIIHIQKDTSNDVKEMKAK